MLYAITGMYISRSFIAVFRCPAVLQSWIVPKRFMHKTSTLVTSVLIMKTSSTLFLLFLLSLPCYILGGAIVGSQRLTEPTSFENDFEGWDISPNGSFVLHLTPNGAALGSYILSSCDSLADSMLSPCVSRSSEVFTGAATSPPIFVPSSSYIRFSLKGWDGPGCTRGVTYVDVLSYPDESFLERIPAPCSDSWQERSYYTSTPRDILLRVVDGDSSTSYAWIAIDNIREIEISDIPDGDFSHATFEPNWVATGGFFITGGVARCGEADTGTLTSTPFLLSGDVQFRNRGWDGSGCNLGLNYIAIVRASDAFEIDRSSPVCSDSFSQLTLSSTGHVGETVQVVVVDTFSNNGYAWIEVDDFVVQG